MVVFVQVDVDGTAEFVDHRDGVNFELGVEELVSGRVVGELRVTGEKSLFGRGVFGVLLFEGGEGSKDDDVSASGVLRVPTSLLAEVGLGEGHGESTTSVILHGPNNRIVYSRSDDDK